MAGSFSLDLGWGSGSAALGGRLKAKGRERCAAYVFYNSVFITHSHNSVLSVITVPTYIIQEFTIIAEPIG